MISSFFVRFVTSPLFQKQNRRIENKLHPAVFVKLIARGLGVGLGLAEADDFIPGFELAAFLEQFDALKALQNVAFSRDGAGSF